MSLLSCSMISLFSRNKVIIEPLDGGIALIRRKSGVLPQKAQPVFADGHWRPIGITTTAEVLKKTARLLPAPLLVNNKYIHYIHRNTCVRHAQVCSHTPSPKPSSEERKS